MKDKGKLFVVTIPTPTRNKINGGFQTRQTRGTITNRANR